MSAARQDDPLWQHVLLSILNDLAEDDKVGVEDFLDNLLRTLAVSEALKKKGDKVGMARYAVLQVVHHIDFVARHRLISIALIKLHNPLDSHLLHMNSAEGLISESIWINFAVGTS